MVPIIWEHGNSLIFEWKISHTVLSEMGFLPRQTELALIDDHNGCVDRSLKLRQGQFFAIGFAHVVVHDYGWRDRYMSGRNAGRYGLSG